MAISITPCDAHKPTILIVDDKPENLSLLGEVLLNAGYRVTAANSGRSALRLANQENRPDLILLDVMMPDMDGFQVLDRLSADAMTRDIPVLFLTALDDPWNEEFGLNKGAADYITKPIQPKLVLARIRTQLLAKQARDWLNNQNALLETQVSRRMAENELIQKVSIRALANLAETRDPETGNHILRTQGYVNRLARHLESHPRLAAVLTPHYIKLLTLSAPLHDIGKVGIPDCILQKPGKLTPEEWKIMKTHTVLGSEAIDKAESDAEKPVEFLRLAKEIARWHHEKWDGSGYPDGLSGDAIPVSARLMALADVFDALISRRIYKPPMLLDDARTIIAQGRSTHFDPDMAEAFLDHYEEFEAIARQHGDNG
ncbi:MAG: response regulator [Gammaproteobacteria bacterium]